MCRLEALHLHSGAQRQRRERQYRGTGVEATEIVQGGQKGRRAEGQANGHQWRVLVIEAAEAEAAAQSGVAMRCRQKRKKRINIDCSDRVGGAEVRGGMDQSREAAEREEDPEEQDRAEQTRRGGMQL